MATSETRAVRWGGSRHRARLLSLALVVAVAAAVMIVVAPRVGDRGDDEDRSGLQHTLDTLVTGADPMAPGVTAYVLGPHGAWTGAAGLADVGAEEPMTPDARMRVESVTKVWTATLILLLDQAAVLGVDDTVEQWLPGLLPDGERITIRHLLTNSSGLMDDNDVDGPDALAGYLANVQDPELRARLTDTAARALADPASEVPPTLLIELTAWQPLLFEPGSQQRHSNIGFNIAGMIAERATGSDFGTLLRDRIFEPVGLDDTAYDPQGPIPGPHASGYTRDGREWIDVTDQHGGKGADGGIVTDAADTATFMTRLMGGEVLGREQLVRLQGDAFWGGGSDSGCAGTVFDAVGAGDGFRAHVIVDRRGTRVAVLLLNGRAGDAPVEQAAADAALQLYCAA
jgi:D-alanyl-D-alanine carboxypeptidase